MIKIEKGIKTSSGGRADNQDYGQIIPTSLGLLVVVCDGMGGTNGGQVASKMTTDIVIEEISKSSSQNPSFALKKAIEVANFNVHKKSIREPELQGMGTTITALLLTTDKAILAHVGDSRIYQIRKGKRVFRTWDHSKVFEWVKNGNMTEEEAANHGDSNVITRAIGVGEMVEIDVSELSYQKGDRFVLCTDGIHGEMDEKKLIKTASQKGNLQSIAEQIVSEINKNAFKNEGGHDNLTVAIVEVINNSIQTIPHISSKYSNRIFKLIPYLIILLLLFGLVLNEVYRVADLKEQLVEKEKENELVQKNIQELIDEKDAIDSTKNVVISQKEEESQEQDSIILKLNSELEYHKTVLRCLEDTTVNVNTTLYDFVHNCKINNCY